jgi:membrane protein implicated in regulation of membrane protease activity
MIEYITEVIEIEDRSAWVSFEGEIWAAESADTLKKGQRVRITGLKGLKLQIGKSA